MKKIFAVSIMAVMAVTAANAEIASKAYVDPAANGTYILKTNSTGQNLTALDTAVKANADKLSFGDDQEATTVAAAIANALSAANVATAVQSVVEGDGNGQIKVDGTNINVHGLGSAAYEAATAFDAAGAATTAASNAKSTIDAYTVNTKAISTNPVLGGADIALTSYLKGNDGSAVAAGDTVNAAIGKLENQINSVSTTASNALTADSALNGAKITAGTVPETALDSATQTLINGAVQSVAEGSTNGTIDVDGTDVAVHGLGSAAYEGVASSIAQDGTGLATSAQVYTAVQGATTAASNALDALDVSSHTGDGNVVTSVTQANGAISVDMGITAIPRPSNSCTDCVLHYNGTTYTWEEIARATGETSGS